MQTSKLNHQAVRAALPCLNFKVDCRSSSRGSSSSISSRQHTKRWLQHAHTQYLQPSRLLRYRPAADYSTALANMMDSEYFKNGEVQKEYDTIEEQIKQLGGLMMRFADFDIAGKEMYINKMDELLARHQAFFDRLEQSDDPDVREYLRANDAQMLDGGMTMKGMFEGLRRSQEAKRQWLEEERRVISDPVKHQAFLASTREQYNIASGAFDMGKLMELVTPEVAANAQKDPAVMAMLREITESPTTQTFSKWIDHPNMGPLAAALWKSMQAARSERGHL